MATFAEQMVEKYRTLLADSAGLKSVTVDGQSITYGELEERLRYWESRVAAESGGWTRIPKWQARLRRAGLGPSRQGQAGRDAGAGGVKNKQKQKGCSKQASRSLTQNGLKRFHRPEPSDPPAIPSAAPLP